MLKAFVIATLPHSHYSTFIGVDLGGGKGKNTAVARLRVIDPASADDTAARVEVVDYGTGGDEPFYDEHLISYLQGHPDALVAMDAPLSLPACVRCQLPMCPGATTCDVPIVKWFRDRELTHDDDRKKPRYTPYTQRATEVLLHEESSILPRETLGQGMGPLTARASYLERALRAQFTLGKNFIEVYPKASLVQLFGEKLVARYKRSAESPAVRLDVLNRLTELRFAPGAWREDALVNDHKFDAIICAYTGYLYSRGSCVAPPSDLVEQDGWMWVPAPRTS